MTRDYLDHLRALIQQDPGGRGLAALPEPNLFSICAKDLAAACRHIAETASPSIAIVTGFYIPNGIPPAAETDGPLGALYLARALTPQKIPVHLVADEHCERALQVGLRACNLENEVPLWSVEEFRNAYLSAEKGVEKITHYIAVERGGPSYDLDALASQSPDQEILDLFQKAVPREHWGQVKTMRGRIITPWMGEAHRLFDQWLPKGVTTIGIGDGGNEIGMGKIPWSLIHQQIPNGGKVASRVATEYLIVCGVSNWGAYALARGTLHLLGAPPPPWQKELDLLTVMVKEGPLVDGILGAQQPTVDAIPWEAYLAPLKQMTEQL